jgi:hypothetical protein
MSSIGTGYDLSVTTFSPDGRVFQIEYATKAVDNSGTVVGIKCKDGVVLGVEKLIPSKMLLEGSNRRIHAVHKHAGMVSHYAVSHHQCIVCQFSCGFVFKSISSRTRVFFLFSFLHLLYLIDMATIEQAWPLT